MKFKRKIRSRKNPRDEDLLRYISIKKQKQSYDYIKFCVYYLGEQIGYADYSSYEKEIKYIQINSDYRKKGVGSYLVNYIEEDQKVKFDKPNNLTQNGNIFWEKRKKNPMKKKLLNLPRYKTSWNQWKYLSSPGPYYVVGYRTSFIYVNKEGKFTRSKVSETQEDIKPKIMTKTEFNKKFGHLLKDKEYMGFLKGINALV